jgi:hypothetical protein
VSPIPDNSGGWGVDNLALLVPEPSSISLLLLGVCALVRRAGRGRG